MRVSLAREGYGADSARRICGISSSEARRYPQSNVAQKLIKRRSEVVGIVPNEVAVTRLIGALLLEQNDE